MLNLRLLRVWSEPVRNALLHIPRVLMRRSIIHLHSWGAILIVGRFHLSANSQVNRLALGAFLVESQALPRMHLRNATSMEHGIDTQCCPLFDLSFASIWAYNSQNWPQGIKSKIWTDTEYRNPKPWYTALVHAPSTQILWVLCISMHTHAVKPRSDPPKPTYTLQH